MEKLDLEKVDLAVSNLNEWIYNSRYIIHDSHIGSLLILSGIKFIVENAPNLELAKKAIEISVKTAWEKSTEEKREE